MANKLTNREGNFPQAHYLEHYLAFTLCSELYLCKDCYEMYKKFTILPVFNNMELKGPRIKCCSRGKSQHIPERDFLTGFDFPVTANLCSCCGRELIFFGSWGPEFFWRECQARIDEYNKSPRGMRIPSHRQGMV